MPDSNAPRGHKSPQAKKGSAKNSNPPTGVPPDSQEQAQPNHSGDTPKNHQAHPRWSQRIDWSQAVLNLLLLIVGVRLACIYSGQLNAMLEANRLAGESAHNSQRAWIGIEKVEPIGMEKGASVEDKVRFLLSVKFTLKNYGHTAAQNVRIFSRLEPTYGSNTLGGVCDDSKAGVYKGDVLLPEQPRPYPEGISVSLAAIEAELKQQNPVTGRKFIMSLADASNTSTTPPKRLSITLRFLTSL
jgi:hypothetical protein